MNKQHNGDSPIQQRRWIMIVALSVLAGAILFGIPALAQPKPAEPRWETLIDDDFDGTFPGSWTVKDNSADGLEYYWGTETFTYTSPITGLWAIGGGADGVNRTAGTSTYVDNIDSWLISGPLDVSRAFDGELTFDWWLDTATGTLGGPGFLHTSQTNTAPSEDDWFGWCVLTDIDDLENCQGTYVSGSTGQWLSGTLSLKPYIQATGLATETSSIRIAFHFVSDDDGRVGLGAFLDNVVLRMNYGYEVYLPMTRLDPTPTPSPTPTPTPTPTPSAVDYYDSFDNSGSGWTTHQAWSGLSGCDNAREHLNYKYSLYYSGGRYHVFVPLDCRAGGNHGDTRHIYPLSSVPGTTRPATTTCIGMEGSIEERDGVNPWWSFYGLVFAASEDMDTVYTLEVNNLGDWGIIKRTGYQYPGPNHPYENEERILIEPYAAGKRWPANEAFNQNKLEAKVERYKVTLYINDQKIYTITEPYLVNEIWSLRKIGILGGNWEITPTQIGYDYFFVDEGCDTY